MQKTYKKHHSFEGFAGAGALVEEQRVRAIASLEEVSVAANKPENHAEILQRATRALGEPESEFKITPFIADEMALLTDAELPEFLYHRYRYEVFPKTHELDDYPPYLQIEPASICNYRCVFCYQANEDFSRKESEHMGVMSLDTYQSVVDQVEGRVQFISLASRGEPLICKDLPAMLEYSRGKFLNLKLNTNASLLNEKRCHDLLNGAIRTLVFSADAAEEPLYSQLRVRGSLDRVLRNIEMFQKIRERDYPEARILTRVSGVMVDESMQDMDSMQKLWGGLVDQISFVAYNPWENIYKAEPSGVDAPCSDLWRRIFVWYDGKVNPCDTDYESTLKIGLTPQSSVSEIWCSKDYDELRKIHLEQRRMEKEPCRRCVVT
ncbi:SPASM domain-containing protein [Verrucomicrobia bacterium]|nr:SPASM domain-containing protein [Verrucomicrobiota bacterium]